MTLRLYANPYDTSATGFYFEDFDEFEEKSEKLRNRHGDPVEEFEIDFIDGDSDEQMLFEAMSVNQGNLEEYFDLLDDLDDEEILKLSILMDDLGYDFDDAMDKKDDLIVYGEFDSDKEFAYEYLEEPIHDSVLETYFDYEALGFATAPNGWLSDEDIEANALEDADDNEIGEWFVDNMLDGKIQNLKTYYDTDPELFFDWDYYARDLVNHGTIGTLGKVYYDSGSV